MLRPMNIKQTAAVLTFVTGLTGLASAQNGHTGGHTGHTMPMPAGRAMPAAQTMSPASVSITGAYVAAQPPVATDTAAFFTLKNTGKTVLTLTGGASGASQSAMLMRFVKLPSGQMSMKMVDKFVVAPGQSLTLTPGGNHLMLMGLKKPLKVGDSVPLTLQFAGGQSLNVSAVVKKF